ncbi:MAG: VTT domain-containing protein, partial [Nanoarchaeota archaeon]|nr:VTT domain-containing protein [Nanoarchaeota archaeon]
MKKRAVITLFIFALIVMLALSYYSYTNQGIVYGLTTNNINSVIADIQSYGGLAALIVVVLVILEVILAPIPPLLLYIISGILFGAFWGGLLVLIGNTLGALIAFLIARFIAKGYIAKKIGEETKSKLRKQTKKYGPLAIFLLRVNPLTSSDLVSYFAGLTNMKVSQFLIATTLGLAPSIFVQTYFGADIIKSNPILLWG